MSVKSFYEVKENRDGFDSFFDELPIDEFGPLRIPSTSPKSASLLGTAFDYGCRFQLMAMNTKFTTERSTWVAEGAARRAKRLRADADTIASLEAAVVAGRAAQQRVLAADGEFDDEAVDAVFRLAQADVVCRISRVFGPTRSLTGAEASELRAAFQLVKKQDAFVAHERCLLNPVFGSGSALIGGADADVIVDNMLIDLKLSASSKLQLPWWREVITYLALDDLSESPRRLTDVAIYLARCGSLAILAADKIRKPKKRYAEFLRWLEIAAADHVGAAMERLTQSSGGQRG